MRPDYATPEDFNNWREHAKNLSDYSLRFIIKDCRDAAANMKGWNPVREGFYEDQAFTYADELYSRRKA